MPERGVEAGERAPYFSMLAVGSGRRLTLRGVAGRKLVLIFHLQETAPTAREINLSVRDSYPSTDDMLVASVIDLSIVPPVYWMTVALILNQAYDGAAKELPPDYDPAEYVIILPDWGGLVSRKYGARNTNRAATVTVVNPDSSVAGSYQGERPVDAVLDLLGS